MSSPVSRGIIVQSLCILCAVRARIASALVLSFGVLGNADATASHHRSHATHYRYPSGHRVVILFARYASSVNARNEAYRLESRLAACVSQARTVYAPLLDEIASITATVHLQHNGHASHVEIFPTRLPAT